MSNENIPFDKWELKLGDKFYDDVLSEDKDRIYTYINKALTKDPTDSFQSLPHFDTDLIKSFNAEFNQSFRDDLKECKNKIETETYESLDDLWQTYDEWVHDAFYWYDDEDFYKGLFLDYLKKAEEKKMKGFALILTKAKKKKGRPQHRNLKNDRKLKREWERAREAKVSKSDFCLDKGIPTSELDSALRNCRR